MVVDVKTLLDQIPEAIVPAQRKEHYRAMLMDERFPDEETAHRVVAFEICNQEFAGVMLGVKKDRLLRAHIYDSFTDLFFAVEGTRLEGYFQEYGMRAILNTGARLHQLCRDCASRWDSASLATEDSMQEMPDAFRAMATTPEGFKQLYEANITAAQALWPVLDELGQGFGIPSLNDMYPDTYQFKFD